MASWIRRTSITGKVEAYYIELLTCQVHDDEHDQEDDANDDYNELEARLSVLEDHREEIDDRFNEDADGELEERVSALEELEERVSGLEAFRQKAYREIANASVSDSHNDDDEELEGRVSALEDDCKACMTHVADIARAVNGLHGDDDYEERVSKLEADREIAAARLDNSVRRFAQADADQVTTVLHFPCHAQPSALPCTRKCIELPSRVPFRL